MVAVAVAAGAGLGTTAVVSAVSSTPSAVVEHGSGMRGQNDGMTAVAELLGMTVDELRTTMREGKSLAQIAESKSVDVDKVIEVLVADAKVRITEMVNKVPPVKAAGESGRRQHRGGMRG